MKMLITSVFGNHVAKDFEIVDIHNVSDDMDETLNNFPVTDGNKEESQPSSDSC